MLELFEVFDFQKFSRMSKISKKRVNPEALEFQEFQKFQEFPDFLEFFEILGYFSRNSWIFETLEIFGTSWLHEFQGLKHSKTSKFLGILEIFEILERKNSENCKDFKIPEPSQFPVVLSQTPLSLLFPNVFKRSLTNFLVKETRRVSLVVLWKEWERIRPTSFSKSERRILPTICGGRREEHSPLHAGRMEVGQHASQVPLES